MCWPRSPSGRGMTGTVSGRPSTCATRATRVRVACCTTRTIRRSLGCGCARPGGCPTTPGVHAAVLAYASDLTLLSASVVPHGVYIGDPRLVQASLDHAMWFHRPFRVDEWLLYDQVSPSASGGRGLCDRPAVHPTGRLIASVVQEGMVRLRRKGEDGQTAKAMTSAPGSRASSAPGTTSLERRTPDPMGSRGPWRRPARRPGWASSRAARSR